MKSFLVIFLIIFDLSVSFSQEDSNSNFWNNVSFGGGIGLNFSDGFFSGTLAPQAIYNFNPYFSAGLGLTGSYSSQKDVFKSTILGGSVLALTNPFPELQLSVELEQVNVSTSFSYKITKSKFHIEAEICSDAVNRHDMEDMARSGGY